MERIYYNISKVLKVIIIIIYRIKLLFNTRRIISESDYKYLTRLLKIYNKKHPYSFNLTFIKFYVEIIRAKKIKAEKIYNDRIKINSSISIYDVNKKKELTIKLAYPKDERLNNLNISVFSSIGMAIFGKKQGDIVSCFEGKRKSTFKIQNVE